MLVFFEMRFLKMNLLGFGEENKWYKSGVSFFLLIVLKFVFFFLIY